MKKCHQLIADYLDGRNVGEVSMEFGLRFFYLIYNNVLEFQYTLSG